MPKNAIPPVPVDPWRYPVIWWYCAVTKEELSKVTLDLNQVKDPFELRERLRVELAELVRECKKKGCSTSSPSRRRHRK